MILKMYAKLLGAVAMGAALIAVQPAAAADLKIGFVNVPRLMQEAPQAQAAREELKEEFQPRERQIKDQRKALQKKRKEFERNKDVMSESERTKMADELQSSKVDLRLKMQRFQRDAKQSQQKQLGKVQKEIKKVIGDIAENESFDLILIRGVAHVSDKIDLTDRVLERLRERAE